MKKQYTKPEIVFEDFSLCTSIAAGCERIINNPAAAQCGLIWGFGVIFVTDVTGCLKKVVDGSPECDSICYHVPFDTNNVFNS